MNDFNSGTGVSGALSQAEIFALQQKAESLLSSLESAYNHLVTTRDAYERQQKFFDSLDDRMQIFAKYLTIFDNQTYQRLRNDALPRTSK